jgi:hypothetical protein
MSGVDQRDHIFLKLFLTTSPSELGEEEMAYFREHPEQIDEVTAPVNIHKLFLWAGALLGAFFVALSKLLVHSEVLIQHLVVREYVIDIVFESGVALIGAAVTAFILGIMLDKQQENAAHWRSEIRRRLGQPTEPRYDGN